jgi:hypothetical protein
MAFMSQDQNGNRVGAVAPNEAKTPMDRAKQIQEMQRAAEAPPAAPVAAPTAAPAPLATSQKPMSSGSSREVFAAPAVQHTEALKGPNRAAADAAIFGAKQVDEAGIFGLKTGDTETVPTGPIWKIIKFDTGEVLKHALDLPKPAAAYDIKVPPNAVKTNRGNLLQVSATPKDAPNEPPKKKAMLVDNDGQLRGVEWGSKEKLQKGIADFPSYALSLFRSVFDGVHNYDPAKHKVESVEKGTKSAYVVKLKTKNEYDGKWLEKTVPLNNFGVKVHESNDPRRHDINVAMYYLDKFDAA